jgi:ribosomal-protein-alanine N-acetyltransferase
LEQLHIRRPIADDAPALLAFELANRDYFEARINARPAAFYSEDGVRAAIAEADAAWAGDRAFQYLVIDAGRIVGRVNLTAVRRPHFNSAELGYRVGADEGGRGVASRAVALCLEQAFGAHGLGRIEAIARPENLGSVRVLERNGFVAFGRSRRSFELHGEWFDRVLFERHRDAVSD